MFFIRISRGKGTSKILLLVLLFFIFTYPVNVQGENTSDVIKRVETLSDQRMDLEYQLADFEAQLTFLNERITKNNFKIESLNKDLEKVNKDLKIKQDYLGETLRLLYEQSQTSFLETLFRSESFSDFVDQNEYLNINRSEMKTYTDEIKSLKSKLNKSKRDIEELQLENQVFKSSIEKQKAEKITELEGVKEQERIIRQKFADRLSKYIGKSYCSDQNKIIKAKYPIYSFPIDCGYISQGFGETEFASIDKAYRGAIHNGVDIAINVGYPIKSIGPGTVYAKGTTPSGGWGNWVIVKQDKVKIKIGTEDKEFEFYSLYSHMIAESTLKVGDKVNTRDLIGLVGGTPYWAPHLHFSLFLSTSGWSDATVGPYPGNVIDPLDYMDIPISTSGTDWDPHYAH